MSSKNIISSKINLNASVLELMPQIFAAARGKFYGEADWSFSKNSNLFTYFLDGENLDLIIDPARISLNKLNFSSQGDSSLLNLNSFESQLNNGSLKLFGNIGIDQLPPTMNINYQLESARVNFLQKSSAEISSAGILIGKQIPYELRGKVNISDGDIREGIPDLIKIYEDKKVREVVESPLVANLIVKSSDSVHVNNSLFDAYLELDAKVEGKILSPKISGKVDIKKESSKFFFKGNSFNIIEGDITFRSTSENIDPYFNFIGETKIDKYTLQMTVLGDERNLSVKFRSEPPLPEEDILSLLTLGVTLSTTRDLQDNDLESVTSMSIGSLLIDQFGINEGLNETLGVKVSVSPEFDDEDQSLISGRINSSGVNNSTKIRSATKIRLTKRISNSVNMSFSSTLGGSLDQRQEMNLNYRINSDFLLQGVYKTQTNDTSTSTDTTDSLGFDLIWKKTFK